MTTVIVLYYSRDGSTRRMANQISRGVASVTDCEALVRTVAEIPDTTITTGQGPQQTATAERVDSPIITRDELRNADGLIVGSPTRFGNMAAPLKHFFDSTSDIWLAGELSNKPGAVFTSTSSLHGGQESTLLSMMLPLLDHGMVMVGIPYTEPALSETKSGGTPYGASHVADEKTKNRLGQHEKTLCTALGKRVASIALKLS